MTSHSVIPFSFENRSIRVVIVESQPMFSARDVAMALGYANPSDAYKTHCKLLKKLSYSESLELKWENPNPQGEYVMPESDVYRMIVKSEKPEAERFDKWLFEDVLPSIRKTGSYSLPGTSPTGTDPRFIEVSFSSCLNIARMCGITGNLALLSADNGTKALTGMSALALIGATHLLADERGRVYTPTELGKMMDPPMSAVKFNLLLEASGLQRKELGGWLPTDEAEGLFEWADTGKRHSNGTPVKQLRWFKEVLNHVVHGDQRLAA